MFGQILSVISLLAALFSLTMYYFTFKNYENTLSAARKAYYFQFGLILTASFYLLYSIITHNYSMSYVYEYSANDLSGGLLLSTFFAGQEGSFLLWLLFTSIIGLFLINNLKEDAKYESSVMMIFLIGIAFLNILILPVLKDPFASLFSGTNYISLDLVNPAYVSMPQIQNFVFTNQSQAGEFVKFGPELKAALNGLNIPGSEFLINGRGLNPLLQNFWMEIHPPILFLGFALTSVPFAFAMSSLLRNEYKTWVDNTLPWLLWGMGILGAGIMIGGYWAYGVLGWGGYWGWDPVENSSLVPWIIGVALIHTIIIQKKSQSLGAPKFATFNLVLGILTYTLVIYSTFLTRSGILSQASVHSFVEPGMLTYSALIGFILTYIAMGIAALVYRRNVLKNLSDPVEGFLNRENALFYGASLLIGLAIIISVGTSSPIFGTSVDVSFYNIMTKPLVIIAAIILGFSLYLGWSNTGGKVKTKLAIGAVAISLVITAVEIFVSGLTGILNYIFLFGAVLAFCTNFYFFARNVKGHIKLTGGQIAHLGAAIMLVGIIMNGNLVNKRQLDMPKGEKIEVGKYTLKYLGYSPIENNTKFAFNVEINDGSSAIIASPVMYNSTYNNSLMREPDIIEGIGSDFYISPLSLEIDEDVSGKEFVIKKEETKPVDSLKVTFDKFEFGKQDMELMTAGKDFKIFADLSVEIGGKKLISRPYMKSGSGKTIYVPDTLVEIGYIFEMKKMDASGSVLLNVQKIGGERNITPETLSAEISIEPLIILVWLGVVILTIGFFVAGYRRIKQIN